MRQEHNGGRLVVGRVRSEGVYHLTDAQTVVTMYLTPPSLPFDFCSVPRQQAAADDVTTDYMGTAVERVQQLRYDSLGRRQ